MFPTFDDFEVSIRQVGNNASAAEVHGMLCCLVCLLGDAAGPRWVADISTGPHQLIDPSLEKLIDDVGDITLSALNSRDMSFRLMLPEDDQPLEMRAEQLGYWCRGFLQNMAAYKGQRDPTSNELVREVVTDFGAIAQAAFADSETEEEGEAAYAELVEYVRSGTQLLFEELQPLKDPRRDSQ